MKLTQIKIIQKNIFMRNPTNVRPFLFFRAIVQQTYLSVAVEDVEIKGEVQKQNRYV